MASWRRTERLRLRPPCEETDASAHLALFSHPAVVSHRPGPTPLGKEASDNKLARDIAHWRDHGFGRWTVLREDGQIIGFGGVTMPETAHGFEGALNLSYHLHPMHWGHGYARELAEEAIRFAFVELEASYIIGLARAWNPASLRVLERAGLTFRHQVELGGAPSLLYAVARAV